MCSPNPIVGAVVVRGGRVVGRGFHARAGEPHAEVVALERAGGRAVGSRLYVNLEPCCHFGRTAPCVDAIIDAGVAEVVASLRDPDPRVSGRGFRALRAAGIRVRVGALRAEARRLNKHFLRSARSGLPFVSLKAGMSLDGRIATRHGESKWITSQPARAEARALRGVHDAVLVGVNTVLADDPELCATRRGGSPGGATGAGRRGPVRVVLDTRLRTPPGSRLLRNRAGGEVVLLTVRGASAARRRRLERAGARVVEVGAKNGRVALRSGLAELRRRGVASVLIEGGSEVLGSAMDERLGDRIVLFVAARLVGGRGARPAFGGLGVARTGMTPRLVDMSIRPVGPDLVIEGRLLYPGGARRG